jgi:4-hydroxybenzoate polyprenyltransferase
LKTWVRALRLHQWAKNLLLFLPLITSHRIFDIDALVPTTIGFLCMGLCASGTYLLNDLFDLDADRSHKRKRNRPLASGALSIRSGLVGSVVLVGAALFLGWALLPLSFFGALTAYLLFTLLYSFRLKRFASLDVIMLAGLFTLRIIAGAAAAEVVLSFWLLAFSMFIFLSLAVVKRVSELVQLRERELEEGRPVEVKGREYATSDLTILQALGACSGYLSVLVLALYINSDDVAVLYGTPELLWLVAPILLLWVTRIWIVTARGYMDEDPIFFAIKDPETWAVAALTGVAILGAKFLEIAL